MTGNRDKNAWNGQGLRLKQIRHTGNRHRIDTHKGNKMNRELMGNTGNGNKMYKEWTGIKGIQYKHCHRTDTGWPGNIQGIATKFRIKRTDMQGTKGFR